MSGVPLQSTVSITLGLTGNIATGKSAVLQMLTDRGACGIDADVVYRELIRPRMPLWHELQDAFGPGILAPDGAIDRRRLGEIVFADAAALAHLDRLTHPAVVREVVRRREDLSCPVVVIDAVKLIESGLGDECDEIWMVTAAPEQQIERLIRRNGLSREQASRRVASQPDEASRRRLATVVIDNSGSLHATEAQVGAAWNRLLTRLPSTGRLSEVGHGE